MFNTQNTKPRRPATKHQLNPCYCGRLANCEECGLDTCHCECRDGAPQESVYGYANPTTAKEAAWAEKLEANR